jgi:hypothetical protein
MAWKGRPEVLSDLSNIDLDKKIRAKNGLDKYEIEEYQEEFESKDCKLDIATFKKVLPQNRKHLATPVVLKKINEILEDEDMGPVFRQNLLNYTRVLHNNIWRVTDYINAVKYISYKLLGDTGFQAWVKVFPERYKRLLDRGDTNEQILNHSKAFGRNKLVTEILEQSLVPSWIVNQDTYQKAINMQCELMLTARSEKVRSDAANSLLTHLKMPEVAKVELDMNIKEDSSIAELRQATMELARMQRQQIEAGAINARVVAEQKVVKGEEVD